MRRRNYQTGEMIFQEGEPSADAYIIHAGKVEIVKAIPDGEHRLAVLGVDEVFGEMGLLEERPRSASARAVEDVVASSVNHEEFIDLILNNPQEGMGLLRALFERLRTMNQLVLDYQSKADSGDSISAAAAPSVWLYGASAEAEAAMPASGLEIKRFPFRIGRQPGNGESPTLAFNDLAVTDDEPYSVSLNHCAIDLDNVGVVVRDRGSRDSTRVNGAKIGARAFRQSAPLKMGENELVLGTAESPYRFRVVLGA